MNSGRSATHATCTAPKAARAPVRWVARVLACLAVLAAALPASAPAQSLEYPVKANYLVKFAAFVDWPAQTFASGASPIVVCVVGDDPFGGVLDRAASAGGASRPISIRRMERIDGRSGCQVAYLGPSRAQTQAQALTALAGYPVLTVTDSARPGPRGIIHFAIAGNRVRFHIDDRTAHRGGLTISSRLLSLAISVRPRGQS